MLLYYAVVNFLLGLSTVLITPLVLSFNPASVLGVVNTVGSAGMLVGSLAMSAWGGPSRKMNGIYAFIALFSLGFLFIGLAAYAYPRLRLVEDELPDVVPDAAEATAQRSNLTRARATGRVGFTISLPRLSNEFMSRCT